MCVCSLLRCAALSHSLAHSVLSLLLHSPIGQLVSWPRVGLGGFAQWATHTFPQTWTARPIQAATTAATADFQHMLFPTPSRNIVISLLLQEKGLCL